jgi:hypothetical protein
MLVQSVQQQKAALAEFGIEAFRTDDLDALLTRAAVLAGQGLGVKRSMIDRERPNAAKRWLQGS